MTPSVSAVRWPRHKLGELCEIIAGQSPPSDTYRTSPEGLPFFQGKADFGATNPVPTAWCVAPVKVAQPGDILISVRAPVGPTNVADRNCCIGRGLAALRCGDLIERDFLLAYLKLVEPDLSRLGSGSTFSAISRGHLENIFVPLPSVDDQRRIAAHLREKSDCVEKARAAAEAQLEAARALPAAYLREVFQSEVAQSWPLKPFLSICAGPGQYGTSEKSNGLGKGLPVLRMGNITEGHLRWDDLRFIELPAAEEQKYRLAKGDILFNRTNSAELVGKTAVFDSDRDAVFASYLIRFRVDTAHALPEFVSAFISSKGGHEFVRAHMGRAIGQVNISASVMHKMPVPVPAVRVQRKIVDSLRKRWADSMKLRQAVEEECVRLHSLPAAILRSIFEGSM